MEQQRIENFLRGNAYPGRGIVVGKSENGEYAVVAYFIMGRSENSRNRVFEIRNGELVTAPFDESKVEDPSLILYSAVKQEKNSLVLANGDQSETIVEGLKRGISFSESLKSRTFEPDTPNLTPRISAALTFEKGDFSYEMSILKAADEKGSSCNRFTFSYETLAGVGHFLHTYSHDGNPLPSFSGEPKVVFIPNDLEEFARELWNALNEENKISLFVRYTSLKDGSIQEKIINKHEKGE